ncbi:hypothetical protein DXV76_15500 [Rhodobacteraceae bacterium CCMM004]|nr:hypothetical protein DXV76_15500 [Rhodobacteraceae bacterium CCMM004]
MTRFALAAAVSLAAALPATADDVTDAIDSARAAYEEGDIQYALEELAFATQLMQAMKAGALSEFLPPAQDGWTRTLDEDEARSMAMLGGTAAIAEYANGSDSFTVQILADNPMVAGFAGIFGNSAMMATMGKIERVGREKFLDQDGDLTGVVGNRILIQASGGPKEAMIAHLAEIDFRGLQGFGS